MKKPSASWLALYVPLMALTALAVLANVRTAARFDRAVDALERALDRIESESDRASRAILRAERSMTPTSQQRAGSRVR